MIKISEDFEKILRQKDTDEKSIKIWVALIKEVFYFVYF